MGSGSGNPLLPSGILSHCPRYIRNSPMLFKMRIVDLVEAYDAGPGAYSVASICFFSFFTGAGSCSAFTASIKTGDYLVPLPPAHVLTPNSRPQLPRVSRNRDGFPASSFWTERVVLRCHCNDLTSRHIHLSHPSGRRHRLTSCDLLSLHAGFTAAHFTPCPST